MRVCDGRMYEGVIDHLDECDCVFLEGVCESV